MARRIKKLKVDRIAILTGPEPATKYPLTLLKSDEPAELSKLYEEMFGEEFDLSKAECSLEEAKEYLNIMKSYLPDIPDEVEFIWKKFAGLLIKHNGGKNTRVATLEEKMNYIIEKLEKGGGEEDKYPSLGAILKAQERAVNPNGPEEEMVPDVEKMKKIQKNALNPGPPTKDNPFPSMSAVLALNEVYVHPERFMKSAAEPDEAEEDELEDELEAPKKKSLDSDEHIEVKKESEVEDLYPSITTPFDLGAIPHED